MCLILGDNIFYGQGFRPILEETVASRKGVTIFGYRVQDPELLHQRGQLWEYHRTQYEFEAV